MDPEILFPDWRELVRYAAPGPQPTLLLDEPGIRVLIAGLEPGARIPAHPERRAVYHILEGDGWVSLDDDRRAVSAGATVIVPSGTSRGFEARTRLAFLAVRVGPDPEAIG
jgi:quercetin dioxygenase-like cupin family protein